MGSAFNGKNILSGGATKPPRNGSDFVLYMLTDADGLDGTILDIPCMHLWWCLLRDQDRHWMMGWNGGLFVGWSWSEMS